MKTADTGVMFISQGMPGATRSWNKTSKEPPLELHREHGSTNTLTSDLQAPEMREYNVVLSSKSMSVCNLLTQTDETNISLEFCFSVRTLFFL